MGLLGAGSGSRLGGIWEVWGGGLGRVWEYPGDPAWDPKSAQKCDTVIKNALGRQLRGSAPDPPVDTRIPFLPLLEPLHRTAVREKIVKISTNKQQ